MQTRKHPPSYTATSAVGLALRARVGRRARRMLDDQYWKQRSEQLQRAALRRLITKGATTEFGRDHQFRALASVNDDDLVRAYRAQVPLRDWYGFKDQIARMREHAEPDVLWPGRVDAFCQTSGTTAGDKFIPLTRAMLRANYLASLDIFASLHNLGISIPRLTGGRSLFLGGSTDLEYNEHGIATGDLSGLVTPMIRWPITRIYSPGRDIALMRNWPDKIDAMARLTLAQDIRMISGMPSWVLVLMDRVLELAREAGRPASCIRDIWPDLTVFVHGGVKYDPFRTRIAERYSGSKETDLPHRLELYPASEAFIAIQDRPGDPGLRVIVDSGVFFEFVPLEQIDSDAPEAFTVGTVDKGQRYVVVITTCAGLWRYILGDVVVFESLPSGLDGRSGDGPARLRIVGRHRHFINAFGENIIVEHIEEAVALASERTGLTVGEFTAAPVYPSQGSRAGLELALEIEAKPRDGQLDDFRDAFDRALMHVNIDYTTKRSDDLGMAPPTLSPLEPRTFHRWLESKGKLGGQHKCPRCANHRDYIEEILAITGSDTGAEC